MGAAAPLSMAATGLQAGGSLLSGFTNAGNARQQGEQTAQFDEFRAKQLQNAAEFGEAKASQTDDFLRQRTMTLLGNLMATNASANVSPDSPTGAAIAARTQGQQDQQRSIKVSDLYNQAAQDRSDSAFMTQAAQQTLDRAYANSQMGIFGGILGGLTGLAQGLSGVKLKP